jgi:hypothetical protein
MENGDQVKVYPCGKPELAAEQYSEWRKYGARLLAYLMSDDLFIASIDGVATDYFSKVKREKWDLGNPEHFPMLLPPRPVMWFEYVFPRSIVNENGRVELTDSRYQGRAGTLVLRAARKDVVGEGIPERTAWVVVMDSYFQYGAKHNAIEGPNGAWTVALDEAGRILGIPTCQAFTGNDPEAAHVIRLSQAWMHPPLLALSRLPNSLPEDQMEVAL